MRWTIALAVNVQEPELRKERGERCRLSTLALPTGCIGRWCSPARRPTIPVSHFCSCLSPIFTFIRQYWTQEIVIRNVIEISRNWAGKMAPWTRAFASLTEGSILSTQMVTVTTTTHFQGIWCSLLTSVDTRHAHVVYMQAKHSYIKSFEKKCPGTEKWCCYANNLTLEAREQVNAVHWPHSSSWVWVDVGWDRG